ncbi:hypothetical protein PG991_001013 [Apiospora marii]|uniref:Actin-like ATPase domain-containing protein n=1 Tax=Apiospora marii TaxID=335849 RepID=A0ABR1STL7_9PEZI
MGLSHVLGRFASKLKGGLAGADGNDDELLVIGIDFGTTSSGVGWATAADITNDQINIITSWPGSGREEGKAPTEMFYERGKKTWGFEVGNDCDPVRWFKLLLLKEEDLDPNMRSSEFVLRARQHMRDEGKTAVELVADYLRALWAHTLDSIARARGEVVVDVSRFHVVITVPAIWKPYARQAMRDAADKAGVLKKRLMAGGTSLSFVAEPEAAALSALSESGRNPKKDDVYLICDGGGGTVDLITYKILETGPLALEEAVEGYGGLCGAIFIDQAFQRKVKKSLGRKWDRLSKVDINELMNNSWEYGPKHRFSLSHDMDYSISIPSAAFAKESDRNDDQCDPPIKDGRMVFKKSVSPFRIPPSPLLLSYQSDPFFQFRKHVKAIFDEVIKDLDVLVDGQIAEAKRKRLHVTGIILVGGFGSSPYLYEHLRDRHKKGNTSVLQSGGERPQTRHCHPGEDVVPVKVVSTIARASYGITYYTPWDPVKHKDQPRIWDEKELGYMCQDQMRWYLRKASQQQLRAHGSNVIAAKPVSHKFYHLLSPTWGGSFQVQLFQCELASPPTRQDSSVKRVCVIKCKLSTPVSDLPDYFNSNGKWYKKLSYDVDMVPSGASVEFSVWFGGKRLGSSEAQIRFE